MPRKPPPTEPTPIPGNLEERGKQRSGGGVYWSNGKAYARVRLGKGRRPNVALPTCTTAAQADERLDVIAALAADFHKAGLEEKAIPFLKEAASAPDKAAVDKVKALAAKYLARTWRPDAPRAAGGPIVTIRDLGERWTSGALALEHPDHVKTKRSAPDDKGRLEKHVYLVVEDIPIADFTLDHAEAVMRSLSSTLAPASRRHVAQLLHRLMSIAVYPLRLRAANPLPRGFLPKVGPPKAKGFIHPDEDARLLASPAVPLCWRVFWGFLMREGTRASEAAGLSVFELDLQRGGVELDRNKTKDHGRAWPLAPGVASAIAAFLKIRQGNRKQPLDGAEPVFIDDKGRRINPKRHLADLFRAHLRAAGIDRAILFESTAERMQIRVHDTRATFTTTALANGETETWVTDRTGHKSSAQIQGYRRAARTAAELDLGDLRPLDQAIPELTPPPMPKVGGEVGGGGGGQRPNRARPTAGKPRKSSKQVHERGVEPLSLAAPEPKNEAPVEHLRASALSSAHDPAEVDEAQPTGTPSAHVEALPAHPGADRDPKPANPRAGLLEALLAGAAAAAAAGDMAAARIAHEAAGRLLGAAGPDAGVVDLDQERRARGR